MLSGENRNGNKKGIQESLGASLGSWEESVSHDVILRRPDSLGMGSEFQEYVNRQSFWVASNSLPPPPSRHKENKSPWILAAGHVTAALSGAVP